MAAFALAICSRSAADDFLNWGGDSAPERVVWVDLGDETENVASSPDAVVDDFWEVMEPFLGVNDGAAGFLRIGADGFLNTAFGEGLSCRGRLVAPLNPVGDVGSAFELSILGVLDRGNRNAEGVAS